MRRTIRLSTKKVNAIPIISPMAPMVRMVIAALFCVFTTSAIKFCDDVVRSSASVELLSRNARMGVSNVACHCSSAAVGSVRA